MGEVDAGYFIIRVEVIFPGILLGTLRAVELWGRGYILLNPAHKGSKFLFVFAEVIFYLL